MHKTLLKKLRRPPRSFAVIPGAILIAVICSTALIASAASASTTAANSGWLRFGHFVASAPPVDVEVNGTVIGTDIGFRDVTGYVLVHAGANTVTISSAAAGPNSTVLASVSANVPNGGAVTVAAFASTSATTSSTGTVAGGITLSVFTDDLSSPPAGDAKIRVIHTIPGAPVVDTSLTATSSGSATPSVALSPVGYKQASSYEPIAAGTYNILVKTTGGTVVTQGNDWLASAGSVITIVIVEAPSGPTLEILSDAVGTSTTPNGAMQTGFGGTAPRANLAREMMLPVGFALVFLIVFAVGLRIRLNRRLVPVRNS
ncbi:MAG: DUF4397 domain-containing protein [Acidimicrobiales bacterium]